MYPKDFVTLNRDCEARQIPSGVKIVLPKGSQVGITQSLGGTYTVITDDGYMVRIDGNDADALGKDIDITAGLSAAMFGGKPAPAFDQPGTESKPIDQLVWNQLKTC